MQPMTMASVSLHMHCTWKGPELRNALQISFPQDIDAAAAEILDEPVLVQVPGDDLNNIAQRSRVTGTSQGALGVGPAGVQPAEALLDQGSRSSAMAGWSPAAVFAAKLGWLRLATGASRRT